MKKVFLLVLCCISLILVTGCDVNDMMNDLENASKPNVTCSVDKQYHDTYSYYIEGTCINNSTSDYDYLQVEFICYDASGNNLGTAMDNTNNLLGGQNWKYKAFFFGENSSLIDHCDYHEVTGW